MKAILRIKKLNKYSQISRVQAHNERTKPTPNSDPRKQNIKLLGSDSVPDSIRSLLDSYNIKPRKNAVLAVEYVLTASPEAFRGDSAIDLHGWIDANIDFIKRRHGVGAVAAWAHLDETTPHIHFIVCPLVNRNGDVRLCARDFFGGAHKLSQLQTEYASAMKLFGLERGVKGSQATHKTIKRFYAELNVRARKSIDKLKSVLNEHGSPKRLGYKKQHECLISAVKAGVVLSAENEQLKEEISAIRDRAEKAEHKLERLRDEYRELRRTIGGHSLSFVRSLFDWVNGFLYDPDAPDLKKEAREADMVRVFEDQVSSYELTCKWAHVIRGLAIRDKQELTLKK